MALYMWMARYTPAAIKSIVEGGSNREEEARKTIEAAGGEMLGFYGLIGQEHHVALIADMPSVREFLGLVITANLGGAIESHKTIPLYVTSDTETARDLQRIEKRLRAAKLTTGRRRYDATACAAASIAASTSSRSSSVSARLG